MGDKSCQQFQSSVSEYLVHNRSILDVMAKLQESSAHLNRTIVKSVTACGCLKIKASKQQIPGHATLSELASYMRSHLEGSLCPNCAEVLEDELGNLLFYLAGTCSLLGLDMDKVICKESEKLEMLGMFNLT